MAIWSALTNAVGGAFKNLGDAFGGDQNQSYMDRFGKGFAAAYDLGLKAPADALGMLPSTAKTAWNGFNEADQRAYTDIISHPISDLFTMGSKVLNSQNQGDSFWKSVQENMLTRKGWIDSWEDSSHYSPGQSVMLASNNLTSGKESLAQGLQAQGMSNAQLTQLENSNSFMRNVLGKASIDPKDTNAVNQMIENGGWGYRVGSGSVDFLLRWNLDPGQKFLKLANVPLKAIRNNPVNSYSDINKVMATKKTQRFLNWTAGKSSAEIAEHPVLRNSAYRWTIANALSGSQSANESSALFRTLLGDKQAYEELLATNQALAFRNANLLAPPEVMEKWALASGDIGEMEKWLQPVEKSKAAAAQSQLSSNIRRYNDVLDAAGSLTDRTASSPLAELSAAKRASFKYAQKRPTQASDFLHPTRLMSTIQDHAYNVPITLYHALTDKPAMGFINHGEDSAPDQVRSWLNKSNILTPDEKMDFAQRYAKMDRGQRAAGWNRIENEVYEKVADAHGIAREDMAGILNQTRGRQMLYSAGAKSGAYGVITTPNGQKLNLLATANGELVAHPDLITQLQRGAVPMTNLQDIERAISRMDQTGVLANIKELGGTKVLPALTDMLDRVYGIWKPLSLMTMHRAYNHIGDDFLRGAAKLGGFASVDNAVQGVGNFMANRIAPFTKNMWVRNQEAYYEQSVATAKAQFHGLLSQAKDQKARIANGERIPAPNIVSTSDVRAAADRYTHLRDNKPTFTRTKARLGTGSFVVPGTRIRVDEAFGGPNSDYWRNLTSSEQFFQSQINDTAHNMYQSLMSNSSGPGFDIINASDNLPAWTKAYRHYVNNQLRPDPVAKMLLNGNDPRQVDKWLSQSPQGQQYMKMLGKADTAAQVQAVQDHIDKYLPTQQLKDAALSGRGVSVKDINATWKVASQMPEVNGNLNLLMHGGHPAQVSIRNTTNKLLKLTGTMPDDIMVRHPIFNQMYKGRVSPLIRTAVEQAPGGKLTTGEVSRLQAVAMKQARQDLRNLVYDTSRFNDAGHMLRFISPFFNAWFNALTSWSKLFAENPSLIARASMGKDAIWGSPLAIDTSTGQQAKPNTPMGNLALVVHLPKPVASALGAGDLSELPFDASTILSPTYSDSIGNPGFGPLVQVPVNQLAKMSPTVATDPMVESILGNRITANSLQALIPSSATQAIGMLGDAGITGQSSDALNRASLVWSIYQEQMYQYQSGERLAPPNINDIQGQAAYVSALDTILNRLSPLGFKPQATHQFYSDAYKQMLGQDPQNAQQNFIKKYGEQAYVFTQSLGKNVAGVPATVQGIQSYKKYEGLIKDNPDLASVVIGPQGTGNFDEMAYQWEVANGLRTYLTPEQAAQQVNIGQGWFNYNQMMAKVNIVLAQRGLTSINQSGAADLRDFKDQYIQSTDDPTSQYYNPQFFADYGNYSTNAYQQRIQGLEKLAQDPALVGNPLRSDIRSLNAYFQLRSQAMDYLSQRQSKSLKTSSNQDVANWFDYYVGQLTQDNTQFSQLYERYLKNDTLTLP